MVEVSVREGRAIKTQPGKNDDSPELHEVINMVVDDPEEQSLSVRLLDEDGLVKKVRCASMACLHVKVCLLPHGHVGAAGQQDASSISWGEVA